MKPELIIDQLDLELTYRRKAAERHDSMRNAAHDYAAKFDAAYQQRLFQRELDREQWKNVILPSIQKRAMLAQM